ncbi:MAG: nucleoside triphosphate pyrophosphatase [Pseudomonadota bacterium]
MAIPRIILASRSKARNAMLRRVGIPFETIPAFINEEEILKQMLQSGIQPEDIAMNLAEEKATVISKEYQDNTVIGSDQVLIFDGHVFQKAQKKDEARQKLKTLRGKTHTLISTVCLAKKGDVIWEARSEATLQMRDFDDAFLEDYLESAGSVLMDCVGCYAIEESGAWLFDKVEGDIFTIMGMPLLPLLGFMKELGFRP